MSLLILADSQVERVWRNVCQNRELLRTATYVPVKRIGQLHDGARAMTAQVCFLVYDRIFHSLYMLPLFSYIVLC